MRQILTVKEGLYTSFVGNQLSYLSYPKRNFLSKQNGNLNLVSVKHFFFDYQIPSLAETRFSLGLISITCIDHRCDGVMKG